MDIEGHFHSLAAEFQALQGRVRNIIHDAHWQTDGEWRESILRTVLRRHLPESVAVGRGFITSGAELSTQIDVLVYDRSAPVLYRDNDLVIVTPDAVRAIIEVRSTARRRELVDTARTLVRNGTLAAFHDAEPYRATPLLGLFAYECERPAHGHPSWVLRELHESASMSGGTIDQMCLGADYFVHYWRNEPKVWASFNYNHWHLYHLQGMAAGYFVNNVVQHIAGESVFRHWDAWFPDQGKEVHMEERVAFPNYVNEER